ncbi:MAG: N-6 DNA methylase [Candidatus Lokiarchaeota archaeon]|nr:N-6 DNA methylase [Candidatus Lokiarchaeota archaeon]
MPDLQNSTLLKYMNENSEEFEITTKSGVLSIKYIQIWRIILIEDYEGCILSLLRNLRRKFLFDYLIYVEKTLTIFENFGMFNVIENVEPESIETIHHIHSLCSTTKEEKVIDSIWRTIKVLVNTEGNTSISTLLEIAQELFNMILKHTILEQEEVIPDWLRKELKQKTRIKRTPSQKVDIDYLHSIVKNTTEIEYGPRILELLHELVIIPLITFERRESKNFENLDSRLLRRKTGAFYTPQEIAHRLASETLFAWFNSQTSIDIYNYEEVQNLSPNEKRKAIEKLKEIRIIDPAVGAGVFLIAAGEWLFNTRIILNDQTAEDQIRLEIATENLFGVDIQNESVEITRKRIWLWIQKVDCITPEELQSQIKCGNSLIGEIRQEAKTNGTGFHWWKQYDSIIQQHQGFDIVLGNPPYGNIIGDEKKKEILSYQIYDVSTGRKGSWNAASLFIVRSTELLRKNGYLGLLLPNSILRVNQFTKTRNFILKFLKPHMIIDEASPIKDVTLEMFSLIAMKSECTKETVEIVSKRPNMEYIHEIPFASLKITGIFTIYYDTLLDKVLDKGKTGVLSATRGTDIPKESTSKKRDRKFEIPYITSGRSVKRYRIIKKHLKYSNDTFRCKPALIHSYNNDLLVATKNYPYPRCTMKEKGIIHGGGIVRIKMNEKFDPRVIGLILNSRLIQYICIRYFTNYSQLTTCLNTGIMENIPIAYPENPDIFRLVFLQLEEIYNNGEEYQDELYGVETLANALVYELYLMTNSLLLDFLGKIKNELMESDRKTRIKILDRASNHPRVQEVYANPLVKRIEQASRRDY